MSQTVEFKSIMIKIVDLEKQESSFLFTFLLFDAQGSIHGAYTDTK